MSNVKSHLQPVFFPASQFNTDAYECTSGHTTDDLYLFFVFAVPLLLDSD